MLGGIKGYLYLAAFLALLAAVGAIYAKGRIDARHAVEMQILKTQIKVFEEERAREEAARKADAAQALQDRKDADLDSDYAKELFDALEDPSSPVFSAPDSDGLRDYAGGKHKAKSAGTSE